MIIEIDKMKINYIKRGQGKKVILFLHGWGANIDTMIPAMKTVENKYTTIAVDLPGFGQSDEPHKTWNAYDYAEFIYKFINKLNLEKISLVGHSHGGRTAIILSAKYGINIDKLVLIDSAGLPSKKSFKYYLKIYSFKLLKKAYKLMFFWKDNDKTMEKFYQKFGSEDYKNAHGIMRSTMVAVLNDDLSELLPQIKNTTLLIWGENDEATPLYMGKIMKNKINGSGLVILKDAGHYSYIDQYAQFDAVMKSFFEVEKMK